MSALHAIPYFFTENGNIPNHPELPLLLYPKAISAEDDLNKLFNEAFRRNHWGGIWIDGVFHYHHYHSTAHEVLGVVAGSAQLIFGGPGGREVSVNAGDMVVIPAGVGHYRKDSSSDFQVIGAYPIGQEDYDTCTEADNVDEKKQNIKHVPLPEADPLEGSRGPLLEFWERHSTEIENL